ncbi:MAG TPA: hypothetical protein EYH22_01815 [Candidatus Nanopusillus sp.]|nr:hypothetical protein [Candidatus Nanopusillus sp.]
MADAVSVAIDVGTLLFFMLAGVGGYALIKANTVKEKMELNKTIDDKSREAYQMSKLKAMEKTIDKLENKSGPVRA